VWTYIPLGKITSVALVHTNADVLTLALELPHGDRVESRFAAARQNEVDRFLNQLLEWAPDAALKRENV
jgi:hypothetical protein